MRRSVFAAFGFALVMTACGCGGDGNPGKRVKLSELAFAQEGTLRFRGNCPPPGRLTVDFRPGDTITIRATGRVVASLSADEAFINCPGAQIEESTPGGMLFRRFTTGVSRPTRLVCLTDEEVEFRAHPIYEFDTNLIGGVVYVLTPPHPDAPGSRALVASSLHKDGESRLDYHTPRCRRVPVG